LFPAGAIQGSHTFLPLNSINGGNFSPAAFVAITRKTVIFSLLCPLVAQWEAVPTSPTTLILLGSKQKLVSSRFHTCLGEILSLSSKSQNIQKL